MDLFSPYVNQLILWKRITDSIYWGWWFQWLWKDCDTSLIAFKLWAKGWKASCLCFCFLPQSQANRKSTFCFFVCNFHLVLPPLYRTGSLEAVISCLLSPKNFSQSCLSRGTLTSWHCNLPMKLLLDFFNNIVCFSFEPMKTLISVYMLSFLIFFGHVQISCNLLV